MKNFYKIFLVLALTVFGGLVAGSAYSQSTQPTEVKTIADSFGIKTLGLFKNGCPKIPIVIFDPSNPEELEKFSNLNQIAPSHSLVFCTDLYIKLAAIPFILKYTVILSTIVSAVLVLAILLFSFKVFMGEANIRSITLTFFFKVVLVLTVVGSNPFNAISSANKLIGYKDLLVDAPRKFGTKIIDAVYNFDTLENINGIPNPTPVMVAKQSFNLVQATLESTAPGIFKTHSVSLGSIPLPSPLPSINLGSVSVDLNLPDFYESGLMFQLFDKHIFSVLDLETIVKTTGEKSSKVGVATILTGLLLTSDVTAMLGIVILIYIFVLVVALAQAILMFITAHLILTILFAMAPITVPCLLIPRTENITKRWFMAIISYTLQPLVFMMFFAFVVILLDKFTSPLQSLANDHVIERVYKNAWGKIMQDCKATDPKDCTNSKKTMANNQLNELFNFFGVKVDEVNEYSAKPLDGLASNKEKDITKNGTNGLFRINPDAEEMIPMPAVYIKLNPDNMTQAQKDAKKANGEAILTRKDIQELSAYLMGICVLLIILVSFLQFVPSIVEALIGRQAPGAMGIVQTVTSPLQQLTNMADKQSGNLRHKIAEDNKKLQQEQSSSRPK